MDSRLVRLDRPNGWIGRVRRLLQRRVIVLVLPLDAAGVLSVGVHDLVGTGRPHPEMLTNVGMEVRCCVNRMVVHRIDVDHAEEDHLPLSLRESLLRV